MFIWKHKPQNIYMRKQTANCPYENTKHKMSVYGNTHHKMSIWEHKTKYLMREHKLYKSLY